MIAGGELPMKDIISHTFPLSQWRKGIDQVGSGGDNPVESPGGRYQQLAMGVGWIGTLV